MSSSTKQVFFVFLTLAISLGATAALIMSRKEPERVERPSLGPLVQVTPVSFTDLQVEVRGQGEVSPRVQVDLAPQVTGRVVKVHPALLSGTRFRAGTVLLRVDPRDYELVVERAQASVASAQTVLERELAEAEVAIAEWRDVQGDAPAPELLAREPQIREARARLAAAEADLSKARLDLERTRLSLPFDGVVIEESVDVGQLVTAGQRVGTVYGTSAVEIRLPLDDSELAWFDLPKKGEKGPEVIVEAELFGGHHTWTGRLERYEARLDPRSRMVHVVVVVDNPFASDERPPLLPGTFVQVSIAGRGLERVMAIPRHALREGETLWVAEGETLRIREVEVARRERERVLIRSGLDEGEMLVVSALDVATDGMEVRLAEGVGDE